MSSSSHPSPLSKADRNSKPVDQLSTEEARAELTRLRRDTRRLCGKFGMDQKEENELREVYARHMEAERDRKMKMEEKNKKGEDSLDGNVARAGNWEKESEGNSDRRGNRPEEENGNGI